jgi:hypothetical protein
MTRTAVSYRLTLFLALVISSTLNMEATRTSETLAYNKPTRRRIPEVGILHPNVGCKVFWWWLPENRWFWESEHCTLNLVSICWDVILASPVKAWCFGETYHFHLEGGRGSQTRRGVTIRLQENAFYALLVMSCGCPECLHVFRSGRPTAVVEQCCCKWQFFTLHTLHF